MIKTYQKINKRPGQADVQPRRLDFGWLWESLLQRKIMLLSIIFLIVTLPIFFLVIKYQSPIQAAWMDDSWLYRKAVAIPSHTTAENNVYVTVPTFDATDTTRFQSDCGDLRFTKQNGELLPYYVVDCDATANIHVQFDTLPAGASTYYLYYGNPSVQNGFSSADFSTVASNYTVGSLGTEEKSTGPVAYWKFDEGQGDTTYDSTANANNGTRGAGNATYKPTWQSEDQCISGKCLYYDGVDDYISVPNNDRLRFIGSNYTVSVWAKPVNKTNHVFVAKGLGTRRQGYQILTNSNNILFLYSDTYDSGDHLLTGPTYNANEWVFIALVVNKDSNLIEGFVNGKSIGTMNISGIAEDVSGTYALEIGRNNAYKANGFIDDVKIYNYARTAAQIKSDYAAKGSATTKGTSVQMGSSNKNLDAFSNGLFNYWKSDEASGNGVDSSGNNNTSTVSGSNNYGAGKFGNGLRTGVATTNLITNPSVETNSTNWNPGSGNTITRVSTYSYFGSYSAEVTRPSVGGTIYNTWNSVVYTAGQQYVLSMFVRKADGSQVTSSDVTNMFIENALTGINSINSVGNGWYRFVSNARTATGSTSNVGFYMAAGLTIYIDGVQLENSASVTPYADGSLGTGYSWSGTAHASTSSRTASTTTTTTNVNNTTGTIAYWFNSPSLDTTAQCPFGPTDGDTNGGTLFGLKSSGVFLTHKYASGVTVTPQYSSTLSNNTWYHVAYTWDNTTLKGNLYVNGALQQNVSYAQAITIGEYLQNLGKCTATGYTTFNGTLDDIRAYNRALSPKEVRDLYNWSAGPVGYWNMDEGTGISAYDISGNGYVGTLTNGPVWSTGKYGKSLKFNGSDNFVDRGTGPTQVNTVSFWVKPTTTTEYPIDLNGTAYVWINSGTVTTQGFTSPIIYVNGVVSSTVSAGTWQYVTVTTATALDASDLDIGRIEEVGYMEGYIDEVKLYNYPRSQKQIVEDMNAGHPAPGSPVGSAVVYYKLDEGYGTTTQDSSANNYDATLYNTPTWTNNGKFNKALDFDASSSEYLLVANTNNRIIPSGNAAFTTSMWINPDSVTTATVKSIMTNETYTVSGFRYGINSSSKLDFWSSESGGTTNLTSNTTLSIGTWYHIVMAYDGFSAKLYINGKQEASDTSASIVSNTNNITIANAIGGKEYYDGRIDEIKFYTSALTEDEIKLDYNRGSAMVLGSTSTESDGSSASNAASREYCIPGDTTSCSAPVGEWKFDEKTGTNAYDTSGGTAAGILGSDGIGSDVPLWTMGKYGSALFFDGDAFVDHSNILTITGNITINTWVKTNSSGTTRAFVAKYGNNSYYTYRVGMNSTGNVIFNRGNYSGTWSTDVVSNSTISDNKWHFVSAVFDSSYMKIYIDGKFDNQIAETRTSDALTSWEFCIGDDSYSCGTTHGYSPWIGEIDHVRIYNYARTPAQIAYDYNRGGPVGWWKLDECQGGTANDSSGNGNTGTITIGATGSQTAVGTCTTSGTAWYNGVTGKYNSSLNFDGADDYVQTVTATTLGITPATRSFTISEWIKTTTAAEKYLFDNYNGGADVSFRIDGGKVETYISDGTNNNGTPQYGSGYNDGNWHHFVLTWDGAGKETIFVDGKQIGTTTSASITGSLESSAAFRIGTRPTGGGYFNGQIDEVKIFNYALTGNQIKTLYNQGSAIQFAPITGSP